MIQSVTFLSGKDVRVTGYVWQHYADLALDGVTRGFIIPECDSLDVAETFRERSAHSELIGWSFRATLHQDFDYRRFPFGEERLSVPFWPKDFSANVVLVPDLDGYADVTPAALPGIREGVVMPGWDVRRTGFGLARRGYRSRFGLSQRVPQADLPELRFDVVGRKQITGPFVTYLLPVSVVITMAYSILLLSGRDERRVKWMGFDALKVLTACSGVFLVVIFSQIDLRKTLVTRDIVYLECFHLTAYAAIVLVAVNAILVARTDRPWTTWHDNLMPKLLFWPMVFGTVLTFTLHTFY